MIGNNVAHSKLRTKRDFSLNLKTKKFWSESEQRFITLKVTTKGMRIIEEWSRSHPQSRPGERIREPCLTLFNP